jgi:antitoxin component of RelBE/YafQ-DinJ toxin-antitoxin module
VCIGCNEAKPLDAYAYSRRSFHTQRQNRCKECFKTYYQRRKKELKARRDANKEVQVTVRIPQELRDTMKAVAKEDGLTVSKLVAQILLWWDAGHDDLPEEEEEQAPLIRRPLSGGPRRPVEEAEAEAAALVKRLAPARGSGGG